MTEPKFTPGPWLIEPHGKGARGHWFQRDDGEYIAMSCKMLNREEEDANAHLIAAAPELYEAADHMLVAHESESQTHYKAAIAKLRAALAKARGESQ